MFSLGSFSDFQDHHEKREKEREREREREKERKSQVFHNHYLIESLHNRSVKISIRFP